MYEVKWQVDDGYAGPSRPQSTSFDLDDFFEDMSYDDVVNHVEDSVHDDFERNIHWESNNLEAVAEQIYNDLQGEDDD